MNILEALVLAFVVLARFLISGYEVLVESDLGKTRAAGFGNVFPTCCGLLAVAAQTTASKARQAETCIVGN